MLSTLILGAASVLTAVVPPTHAPRANLDCSVSYGCEVVVDGERAHDVSITSTRIIARQVSNGDDGTPIRVQLLPMGAFDSSPDGAMVPTTGKLTIVTESGREFVVIVDATELPQMKRVWFSNARPAAQSVPVVAPAERASGESAPLDPAKISWGWRSDGEVHCATAFSVGLQLWCLLPRSISEIPSVYFDDGRLKEPPQNERIVAQRYLVIDNGANHSSILLEFGGGRPSSGHIVRTSEP